MIIDRMRQDIQDKSFVCLGLDTKLDYVPEYLIGTSKADSLFNFNKAIIDATYDLVAAFKPQIAYYEAEGLAGMEAYARTLAYIKEKKVLRLADIKRGDISSTGQAYAKAHFSGDFEADWITVNPYMGMDSLEVYLDYVANHEKGIFVLVRTSNPGAKDFEYLDVQGQPYYYRVAERVNEMAQAYLGQSGHSSVGFVLGGTQGEDIEKIRDRYQNIPFLIPGYGAQGGQAADIKKYIGQSQNSLVNASRSIILAFQKDKDGAEDIGKSARKAVLDMIEDIEKA